MNNNDNDILQFELCTICKSDDISVATLHDKMEELRASTNDESLTVLRDKIKRLNPCDVGAVRELNKHPFFHEACLNKNVTLDVIEYLLDEFPGIERVMSLIDYHDRDDPAFSAGYPLHLCCYNMHCPSSVIELLLKKFPDALSHYATVQFFDDRFNSFGNRAEYYYVCPLQYYLGRLDNIDIDTVRLLVDGYPQAMLDNDNQGRTTFTALHAFVYNPNINNLQHILNFLLEVEPLSIRTFDGFDRTPLLNACDNEGVTVEVVEILFNKWPEAIRIRGHDSHLPIHELCCNEQLDEVNSLHVLRFMMSIDAALVRERDESDYLPIHFAFQGKKSFSFFKELVEAYPESIGVRTVSWGGIEPGGGSLPIHAACQYGRVDVLQYLLELDPDITNARDASGRLHIHLASADGKADIVEFLLKYDGEAVYRCDSYGNLPLHSACDSYCYRNSDSPKMAQILFDAYPEAIHVINRRGKSPFDLAWGKAVYYSPQRYMSPEESPLVNFLLTQQAYARQAKEITETVNMDENDCTLRCALKDNAPLGSIKLLTRALRGWPHLARHLHIACEFSSAKVVQYLVELDGIPEGHLDMNKDSILHSACRAGNLGVIKYFLDNHVSFVASAEVNDEDKLPIHLLCEAGKDKVDRESPEFIDTIWRMLLANPEAVVSANRS